MRKSVFSPPPPLRGPLLPASFLVNTEEFAQEFERFMVPSIMDGLEWQKQAHDVLTPQLTDYCLLEHIIRFRFLSEVKC